MTKVLERPTTDLRSRPEVLPRPEVERRIPEPPAPRRFMRWFLWLLALAAVAVVSTLVILDAVSEEPVAAPSIQYETLREPYELPQTPLLDTYGLLGPMSNPGQLPAQPVAIANLGLPEWIDLMPTGEAYVPYAASVASWETFLEQARAAEALPKPYAASVAAWETFLEQSRLAAVTTTSPGLDFDLASQLTYEPISLLPADVMTQAQDWSFLPYTYVPFFLEQFGETEPIVTLPGRALGFHAVS